MKRILITGVNGFVGNHLARELLSNDLAVIGIGGPNSPEPTVSLSEYHQINLNDAAAVEAIDFSQVDGIIHLAGLAAVGPSFDNPMEYVQSNIGMEINLFSALQKQAAHPRVVVVSSGSLYDASATLPLVETSPVFPSSPYAVSKLGQENMAQYYASRGFETMIARPFNHIGPGQRPGFLIPDLIQQVVAVERGIQSSISVGNLDAGRDYTDVRDIVRAYRLLLETGDAGQTYNICSGTPVTGRTIVESIMAEAGMKTEIVQDPTRMRPADAPIIYGDHSKLTKKTGWQPSIALAKTLSDTLAEYRSQK